MAPGKKCWEVNGCQSADSVRNDKIILDQPLQIGLKYRRAGYESADSAYKSSELGANGGVQ